MLGGRLGWLPVVQAVVVLAASQLRNVLLVFYAAVVVASLAGMLAAFLLSHDRGGRESDRDDSTAA